MGAGKGTEERREREDERDFYTHLWWSRALKRPLWLQAYFGG